MSRGQRYDRRATVNDNDDVFVAAQLQKSQHVHIMYVLVNDNIKGVKAGCSCTCGFKVTSH